MSQRIFDIFLCLLALPFILILLVVLYLYMKAVDPGPFLHWSQRFGQHNKLFLMPKLRTMKQETPQVPTHLFNQAQQYITPVGKFLRKYSLDELPQIFSIIKGEMSLVGPRPALFNQSDLVGLRTEQNIHTMVPGLTGLAQITGRDDLDIPTKVKFDLELYRQAGLRLYFYILWKTFFLAILAKQVRH